MGNTIATAMAKSLRIPYFVGGRGGEGRERGEGREGGRGREGERGGK